MDHLIFTVRDDAVSAFLPPFFTRSKGEAIRSFSDAVNNPEHQFAKHLTDYALFVIGSYDDVSGVVTGLDQPSRVVTAQEVLRDDPITPPRADPLMMPPRPR